MHEIAQPEHYWRAIVLYGKNTATYKFALAKSLLHFGLKGDSVVHLDDLAKEFALFIVEHLKSGKVQSNSSGNNSFLDACRAYSVEKASLDHLVSEAKNRGFRYVLDAFHQLPDGTVTERFFEIRGSGKKRSLNLTENLFRLADSVQYGNLIPEVEARWILVEDTWTSNRGLEFDPVKYAEDTKLLYVEPRTTYRRNLTSARYALSGYQKGKCFYCFTDMLLDGENSCEVDHFLPYYVRYGVAGDLNCVWNLVLACEECNRGANVGKFDALPDKLLLERLITRNNYLVNSHHPLSNTLELETGKSDLEREKFLRDAYDSASKLTKNVWSPRNVKDFAF